MARHSDGFEDLAMSMLGLGFMVVVFIIAVVVLVLVSLVTELFRIFRQAVTASDPTARRILWSALGVLLVVFALAGSIAYLFDPAIGLFAACWGFFAFVIVCEVVSVRMNRAAPPLPEDISLSDVVSWGAIDAPHAHNLAA